jgi:hypothetical protein
MEWKLDAMFPENCPLTFTESRDHLCGYGATTCDYEEGVHIATGPCQRSASEAITHFNGDGPVRDGPWAFSPNYLPQYPPDGPVPPQGDSSRGPQHLEGIFGTDGSWSLDYYWHWVRDHTGANCMSGDHIETSTYTECVDLSERSQGKFSHSLWDELGVHVRAFYSGPEATASASSITSYSLGGSL